MYPEYRQNHSTKTASLHTPPTPVSHTSEIRVLPVQGNIYMLTSPDGANVTVQIGKQGVLLVDTTTAKNAPRILETLSKLSEGKIRYIINTHVHPDHVGGNENLVKTGGGSAREVTLVNTPGETAAYSVQIIAHQNVFDRMSVPPNGQKPYRESAWPTDTYFEGQKEIYFNDEADPDVSSARPRTPTATASRFFRRSDVISTGDIFVTTGYPDHRPQERRQHSGRNRRAEQYPRLAIPTHTKKAAPTSFRATAESATSSTCWSIATWSPSYATASKHDPKGMTLDQVKAARPTLDYESPIRLDTRVEGTGDQLQRAGQRRGHRHRTRVAGMWGHVDRLWRRQRQ